MEIIGHLSTHLSRSRTGVDLLQSRPAFSYQFSSKDTAQLSKNSKRVSIPAIDPQITAKIQSDFGAVAVGTGVGYPETIPEKRPDNYGQDLAWMVLKERIPQEIEAYVKDPFITNMAEMSLLDRYLPLLEEDIKNLFKKSTSQSPEDGISLSFFQATLGVKISDFNREGMFIKPGVDVLKLQLPSHTEIKLSAGLPVNLHLKAYPDAKLSLTHGLINPSHTTAPQTYLDSQIHYDSFAHDLDFKLGLRHQFNRQDSLALYGKYTRKFNEDPSNQGGIGLFFQKKWR